MKGAYATMRVVEDQQARKSHIEDLPDSLRIFGAYIRLARGTMHPCTFYKESVKS